MILDKYSIGIGDRFGREGAAQLEAIIKASKHGVDIAPVWNKSKREHQLVGTKPEDVRIEADEAVRELGWKGHYFVDADHITKDNVGPFINYSDFFTIDVADAIGKGEDERTIDAFLERHKSMIRTLTIPGIGESLGLTKETLKEIAEKYAFATEKATATYRYILESKRGDFVTEVSMDETDNPQSPLELLLILKDLAFFGVPLQTIAPKFTGRFNKGVDYVGDVSQFTKEFRHDLAVIAYAVKEFGLPSNLKLSVHSGSDKFALYRPMYDALAEFNAGLHLKTAGTTWLEEVIGLAEAGGDGLEIAKEIYKITYGRIDELSGPYATVIDINEDNMPQPSIVNNWSSDRFVRKLRHNQSDSHYNKDFRQLLHIGYKIAAEMGERYLDALKEYSGVIGKNVTENLYERHIKPLFMGG